MSMMTRRKFLALGALAVPAAAGAHAATGTNALRVTKLTLKKGGKVRFVQFTDLHHKGDTRYALELVRRINALKPDFVAFTGDLVEDKGYAPEALDFIRQIESPVYGSPGNHDYWSHAPFAAYKRAFGETGGAWLVDRNIVLPQHDLEISGWAWWAFTR